MSNDRRRQQRLEAKLFVNLEDPVTKSTVGRGVVLDVSLSGFAVETEADLKHNSELGCRIEIPFYLRAKVVRTLPQGQIKRYGLRFINQNLIEKFLLKKLLKGNRQTRKLSE